MDGESNNSKWYFFGKEVSRSFVIFIVQIIIVYIVVITSIVNLALGTNDAKLWMALLSSNIGYLLPNPTLKEKKK